MGFEKRHYQSRVLEGLAHSKTPYTGLVGAGLGTGKTAIAVWNTLEAFNNNLNDKCILIVAPVRTEHGWRRHWESLANTGMKTLSGKASKAAKAVWEDLSNKKPGVYFITWELMRSRNKEKRWDGRAKKEVFKATPKPFYGVQFDMLIADEWHRACNHASLNFQVVSRIRSKHRLALSATPAGNKPCNIWAALKFLWPDKYGGYWDFSERFFHVEMNPFSSFGKTFTGERHPGMVRRGAPSYHEVSQDDANPELPGVIVHRVSVELTREQRRVYRELEQKSLTFLDENPLALSIPMELDLRLRQVTLGVPTFNEDGVVDFTENCKSSKLDALVDIVQDLPENEPFVVWVHSQKFIKAVLYRLRKADVTAIEVSGRSKGDFRYLITGKVRCIVAQHETMSEGVDGLQSVCHTEMWLSQSNSLVINEQATGRLNRQGQERAVNRFLIQAADTIDDRVLGRLQERYNKLQESGLI
nr:MAG TPA: Recombination ATPase helicase [Caudoviricetes sp.]